MIGNLSSNTTEETVLATIGSLTSLPIKSIRMITMANQNLLSLPLPITTNTCMVELHSVYESTELFNILSTLNDGLIIDNNLVTISYGKRLNDQSTSSLISTNQSMALQNAAVAALAAAQWKNLDDSSTTNSNMAASVSKKTSTNNLGNVIVNGVKYTKYNSPDYNSFQYDHNSGFYYDSTTGFHYDSNSQYFYNSVSSYINY